MLAGPQKPRTARLCGPNWEKGDRGSQHGCFPGAQIVARVVLGLDEVVSDVATSRRRGGVHRSMTVNATRASGRDVPTIAVPIRMPSRPSDTPTPIGSP
jgi:hypothetical protein